MIKNICFLARTAGASIMKIYHNEKNTLNIMQKKDLSPITKADIISHKIIINGLKNFTPSIPIISEESDIKLSNFKNIKKYWLVDPLDGTKEFINRNGEFTVNIALIENNNPILGVVYAPAMNILYAGEKKAWKEENQIITRIQVLNNDPVRIVISRSHSYGKIFKQYLNTLGKYTIMKMGSSLKFCLIAEGKAQIYPRFGTTKIWDTAAGHAIAVAAGAYVYDFRGKKLKYIVSKSLCNPNFLVSIFKNSF